MEHYTGHRQKFRPPQTGSCVSPACRNLCRRPPPSLFLSLSLPLSPSAIGHLAFLSSRPYTEIRLEEVTGSDQLFGLAQCTHQLFIYHLLLGGPSLHCVLLQTNSCACECDQNKNVSLSLSRSMSLSGIDSRDSTKLPSTPKTFRKLSMTK